MNDILRRLMSLFGARAADRDRQEQDLKDELAFHFRTEVERRVADGQSEADALASAKRAFGSVPLVEEVTRSMWGWSMQDYKLGLRMLVKFPGLTIAGGVALAIAIAVGAGWYDVAQQTLRPVLPLPDGDRLVEIDVADALANQNETRLLHDFVEWRRALRSVEDLGAYRTIERNFTVVNARTGTVRVAETTASAFEVARVPPLLGRPLIAADERAGAPAVVLLGYDVWQRWFGGRVDVVGEQIQMGRTAVTVVGVMPDGFAFPINHQAWVPLSLRASGYAPLEGGAIRIFGRLAPGVRHRQAEVELIALVGRSAAASPRTHAHLRPGVRAYGGALSDAPVLEYAATHLPILLVLLVACTTVGTLVYARTATREAEIAVRSALGASRRRIVTQLFVEALALATPAAVVGLAAAHWALAWAVAAIYGEAGPPFWMHLGLAPTTVLYAAGLAVVAAGILGILPALKVTGTRMQGQLRNLGSGGSTLRFGGVWTTAMIVQVTLTVFAIPPAFGISSEAVRDRMIRARFPAAGYLAVPMELDRASGPADEAEPAFEARRERLYEEFERRVAMEPGVLAVTVADSLPGGDANVRSVEVEASDAVVPSRTWDVWTATVGPGFFEAFERPIVAGRAFHSGDRSSEARTVIVNEGFVRGFGRIANGASPIGRRLRYARDNPDAPAPWFEIVGVARDIGMTPTDYGEAPYVYHTASPGMVRPAVMGVRANGDPALLAPRLQAIAAELDPGLRLSDVQRLDEVAWRSDIGNLVMAAGLAGLVGLGLFLSAAGIFSMMSVSVSRRTREIGLRAALGATPGRLLRGIFSRAVVLVGSGVIAGNGLLLLMLSQDDDNLPWGFIRRGILMTSVVLMTVAVLACAGPARRALRIQPTDALRET
jgi:predicted permease